MSSPAVSHCEILTPFLTLVPQAQVPLCAHRSKQQQCLSFHMPLRPASVTGRGIWVVAGGWFSCTKQPPAADRTTCDASFCMLWCAELP
mmetsp:Transcript_93172/g.161520  ORF Transcript_93172/g.161520 Transcript_93172/m.161520 type:complete len:89 (+) Transcript_93172:1898-2164(+)